MDVGTWPGFVRISSKTSCAYNTPGKERRPHVWIYSEFTVNLQPVAVRQMFELVGNQERFGFLECFLGPATLLAAGVWQPGGARASSPRRETRRRRSSSSNGLLREWGLPRSAPSPRAGPRVLRSDTDIELLVPPRVLRADVI